MKEKKNLTANHHIQQEMGLYYYIKGGLFAHFSSIADNLFASVLNPCLSNKYGLRSSLKFRFFLCPAFTLFLQKPNLKKMVTGKLEGKALGP